MQQMWSQAQAGMGKGMKRPAENMQVDPSWRDNQSFRPRKICNFFLEGRCQKGPACTFAHSESELAPGGKGGEGGGQNEESLTQLLTAQLEAQLAGASDSGTGGGGGLAAVAAGQGCVSSLQGPREFPANQLPKKVCSLWIRHPALCQEGDACLFAHGLMEMGLDVATSVSMRTSSDESPVDVQVLSGGQSGSQAAGGKGKSKTQYAPGYEHLGAAGNMGGPGTFMKTKMCIHLPNCHRGASCTYAHAEHELGTAQPAGGAKGGEKGGLLKMKMCSHFENNACHKGDQCTFAHFDYEIGTPQPAGGAKGGMAMGKSFGGKMGGGKSGGLEEFAAMMMGMVGKGMKDSGYGKGDKGKGKGNDPFANLGPSRYQPGEEMFMPTKLCEAWVLDPSACQDANCDFAHGVRELQPSAAESCGVSRFLHTGWKPQQQCNFFLQGTCAKGVNCTFAHTPEDAM